MNHRVSRISIHQTSKMVALLYAIFGVLFVPIGVVLIVLGGEAAISGWFLVLMPVAYLLLMYPMTALMCWVYNLLAKRLGGIEISLSDISAP